MATSYGFRVSFLVPTADLAALRTALNTGSGLSADSTASFRAVTIDSVDYYAGAILCTEAMRAALVAFFEAGNGRRYYVQARGSDVITACGPTLHDVGRALPPSGLIDDALNYKTVNDIMPAVWSAWQRDYITNVSGSWTPHSGQPTPKTPITSPGAGAIYNPQVQRGGSTTPGILSEGQSFGMMYAVMMDDSAKFYDIWNRTKFTLQQKPSGDKSLYFARYFDTNQPSYSASAPDGDLGCALALGLAHKKGWSGSTYLTDLQAMAADMWTHYVATHGGRYVFCGAADNDSVGTPDWNNDQTDAGIGGGIKKGSLVFSNYLMIYAFKILAELDTARTAQWTQLITDSLYFLSEAAKLTPYGMPPENFRVYSDGSVHLSERIGNAQNHWYSTSRLFTFIAWAAAEGHQPSIDFLKNESCAQKYREHYQSQPGIVPSSFNSDGTKTTNSTERVAVLAAFAAMESVLNPALAKLIIADIQALYNATYNKWHWNDDTNFIQFCTALGLMVATKKLGRNPVIISWPASAPTRKLHYIADRTRVTIDASNRVSQWNNVMGGYNLTQTNDDKKPLFIPADRFNPAAIRFDGVDDWMQLTGTLDLIKNVGQVSLLAVVRLGNVSTQQYFLTAQAPNPYRQRFAPRITSAGKLSIEGQTLDADAASSVTEAGTRSTGLHVIRFDVNYQAAGHATGRIFIAGVEALAETQLALATGAANTSNTNLNKFTVGSYNEASGFFNGDIIELMMTTAALPTDQNWADELVYIRQRGIK